MTMIMSTKERKNAKQGVRIARCRSHACRSISDRNPERHLEEILANLTFTDKASTPFPLAMAKPWRFLATSTPRPQWQARRRR
jgi:hypothetical protein